MGTNAKDSWLLKIDAFSNQLFVQTNLSKSSKTALLLLMIGVNLASLDVQGPLFPLYASIPQHISCTNMASSPHFQTKNPFSHLCFLPTNYLIPSLFALPQNVLHNLQDRLPRILMHRVSVCPARNCFCVEKHRPNYESCRPRSDGIATQRCAFACNDV